jgi:hypothetical protein
LAAVHWCGVDGGSWESARHEAYRRGRAKHESHQMPSHFRLSLPGATLSPAWSCARLRKGEDGIIRLIAQERDALYGPLIIHVRSGEKRRHRPCPPLALSEIKTSGLFIEPST